MTTDALRLAQKTPARPSRTSPGDRCKPGAPAVAGVALMGHEPTNQGGSTMYELTFWGEAYLVGRMPRYRKYHATLASARREAERVLRRFERMDIHRGAHPAVIYDETGRDVASVG
jgi:hypothetical protein